MLLQQVGGTGTCISLPTGKNGYFLANNHLVNFRSSLWSSISPKIFFFYFKYNVLPITLLPVIVIFSTSLGIRAWISNCISEKVITHRCPNCKDGSVEPPLNLEHGCVITSHINYGCICLSVTSLIARFTGSTWGSSGADRTQVGPMLAPWTFWAILS